MATDIIARGMAAEAEKTANKYKAGANIVFTENADGTVAIEASGEVSSEDTVARNLINDHKENTDNPHGVTAEQIGLGNVDNTSDLEKPISNAMQEALDKKVDKSNLGTAAYKDTPTDGDASDGQVVLGNDSRLSDSRKADGGNADTLDNLHSSSFMQWIGEQNDTTIIGDANYKNNYLCNVATGKSLLGLPIEGWYHIEYHKHVNGNGYGMQIAYPLNFTGSIMVRYAVGTTWGKWSNIADGGNAETLDGLHANEIASNPNLLINPDFKINQRGQMEYNGKKIYTVDNWLLNNSNGTLTIMDDYIRITVPDTNILTEGIFQRLHNRVKLFAGKTVTLSAMIRSNSPKSMVRLWTPSTDYIQLSSGTGEWEIVTKTIQIPESITNLSAELIIPPGEYEGVYLEAKWVKLEYGSVATIFIPPNPAEELLKIQSMDDDGAPKLVSNDALPTIMNSQMVSNPNLLINPDFKINQRGFVSGSIGTEEISVDRWLLGTGEQLTLNDDGSVTIKCAAGAGRTFQQTIEIPTYMIGKTVTLSTEVIDILGTVRFGHNDSTGQYAPYITNTGVVSLTFEIASSPLTINLVPTAIDSYVTVNYVKLELGSFATPFCPPDTATELAKCQRYYQIRSTGDIAEVDLRPSMRATPTITQLSDGNYAYSAEL